MTILFSCKTPQSRSKPQLSLILSSTSSPQAQILKVARWCSQIQFSSSTKKRCSLLQLIKKENWSQIIASDYWATFRRWGNRCLKSSKTGSRRISLTGIKIRPSWDITIGTRSKSWGITISSKSLGKEPLTHIGWKSRSFKLASKPKLGVGSLSHASLWHGWPRSTSRTPSKKSDMTTIRICPTTTTSYPLEMTLLMLRSNAWRCAITFKKCAAMKFYKWKPSSSKMTTVKSGSSTPETFTLGNLKALTQPPRQMRRSKPKNFSNLKRPWESRWSLS